MRDIFLHINVSLDGYICDAAGDIDWAFADAEFQQYLDDLLGSIDGMIFGRVAYEQLAAYWPTAGDEATATQRKMMHELPKFVLSRTLKSTDWHNSHLLGADPFAAIRELAQQPGRPIALFAGGSAATALLEAGLLDELRLVLNPVLLGGGTRLFDGSYPKTNWSSTETRQFAGGATLLRYERANR
ncbi:dihydrofolate reductase [Nocardia cyriacigeorgica]|uniref:Dihydrofolate reductase n=1 Tax=Nocardia cyriacigeorgica TaxID=135487 RepID=A0A6P1D5K4_9NOCA|nr:dihydrofolate reductase family protein [Nocardia cyriacigeorgica]NEW42119.1 dihydrofolate reductase [Nocardia cyriacigeorgica]NEW44839.1 dihydrofolate reductase [Nocardia cyriacigeorgica]NEW53075.1 dihydrofolate reductase [Nocardia cyriacigeorgica]NEW57120.1 dihydrofolate reductase [Nocardia cyriacigeorgica]